MLTVEDRFVIQDLHRKGVSISEIARRTGHDRKTVRQIIAGPLVPPPQKRAPRPRKIDPYVPYLEQRLADGVFNAHKLFLEIQQRGYTGRESQVKVFLHPLRPQPSSAATVRFETPPGHQAQVDWGHFGLITHHGRQRRLYAFLMTLGWSRVSFLQFTVSLDVLAFLRCHIQAFHYFGGVPREMLHDNLKTAVLERRSDGSIQFHPRYLDFAQYYGFTPRPCRPYRAQTKGKVERAMRYVRDNFWPGLHYRDLDDLNAQARVWLDTVANVRMHGSTHVVPLTRLADEGLASLADKPDYDTSELIPRHSTRDCLVSFEGNLYSVPAAYAQQQLVLKLTASDEVLVLTGQGEVIAQHRRAYGVHERRIDPTHYQDLVRAPARRSRGGAIQDLEPRTVQDLGWAAPQVEMRSLSVYDQLLEVVE